MKRGIVIAVSGPPGAGTTTIAKRLASKLKLNYFSPGKFQKSFGKSKKQSIAALEVWKTDFGSSKKFHEYIESMQIERARRGSVVICGKLSVHFLKGLADFRIWVEASLEARARRSSYRDRISVEDATNKISKRENIEREEWKRIYGFDYFDQKNEADLVIDNSNLTVEEAVERIVNFIKLKKE